MVYGFSCRELRRQVSNVKNCFLQGCGSQATDRWGTSSRALNTESIRMICDIEVIFDIRLFVFGKTFMADKKRVRFVHFEFSRLRVLRFKTLWLLMPNGNTTLLHFKKYRVSHDFAISSLLDLWTTAFKLQWSAFPILPEACTTPSKRQCNSPTFLILIHSKDFTEELIENTTLASHCKRYLTTSALSSVRNYFTSTKCISTSAWSTVSPSDHFGMACIRHSPTLRGSRHPLWEPLALADITDAGVKTW
jgi:hypothetical protein